MSREPKTETKEENVEFVEREITLSLINEKLNYIIDQLNK